MRVRCARMRGNGTRDQTAKYNIHTLLRTNWELCVQANKNYETVRCTERERYVM